jgi:hypothetical protein
MRFLFAVTVIGAVIASLSAAQAERRIFIVASNSDGYGVDHCLATGARCGMAAATAFCRHREFAQAVSFHKVGRDEITGVVPDYGVSCRSAACADFIAIECTR